LFERAGLSIRDVVGAMVQSGEHLPSDEGRIGGCAADVEGPI
jgi:hypothetical protein